MTPDKNVASFEKGEMLKSASRLEQLRAPVEGLIRMLQSRFGQPADGQTQVMAVPVELSSTDTGRDGVKNGKIHYPPVKPLDPATTTAALAIGNLGETATKADETEVVDAEVWDLGKVKVTAAQATDAKGASDVRLAFYAGRNSEGRPILLLDAQAAVWVKVTGNATGGGKYNGRILTAGASAPDLTTTLAEADFGTVPADDNCYILNSAEVGQSTHDLTAGTPVTKMFPGIRTGYTHTDGKPFIRIFGADWKDCT